MVRGGTGDRLRGWGRLLSETGPAAAWEPTLPKQLGLGVEVRWVGVMVRVTVTEGKKGYCYGWVGVGKG